MAETGIISLVLIIANIAFSYKGFKKEAFYNAHKFNVEKIFINKEYRRLVTSGFLHVGWVHLIFNVISLYAFSGPIEYAVGGFKFLIIYFTSLVGGNLFGLLVHKNHGDYSSVGASGAVCGIIFASIALFPGINIGFFILPISIPGWLYGIFYVLYSIYGIRSGKSNIGHEAHLGGALIGMAMALIMEPYAFSENFLIILIIAVPIMVFMYLIITRPQLLLVDNHYFKTHRRYYSIDHRYNEERNLRQKELDRILDKISRKGMGSLSEKEKRLLKEYSGKL